MFKCIDTIIKPLVMIQLSGRDGFLTKARVLGELRRNARNLGVVRPGVRSDWRISSLRGDRLSQTNVVERIEGLWGSLLLSEGETKGHDMLGLCTWCREWDTSKPASKGQSVARMKISLSVSARRGDYRDLWWAFLNKQSNVGLNRAK